MKVGAVKWLSNAGTKVLVFTYFMSTMVTTETIKREKFAEIQRAASKLKKQLRQKPTKHEKKVFSILKVLYPRTVFQKSFLKGGVIYIVDFFIPFPYGIVLELDGNHHFKGEQKRKDIIRDKYMRLRGFIVVRIRNSEIPFVNFKTLIENAKQRRHEKT